GFSWDAQRTLSRLTARAPEAALAALSSKVGGALADSLVKTRAGVSQQANALVEQQKQQLAGELDRQKQALVKDAAGQLEALFQKRSAAPPPPPADSLAPAAKPAPPPGTAPAVPPPAPTAAPESTVKAGG